VLGIRSGPSREPRGSANLLARDDAPGRSATPHASDRLLDRRRAAHRRGEGSRKARNLAADGRCVIGTSSTRLPSVDLVVEGRAHPLTDLDAVRRTTEFLGERNWPLEAQGNRVYGPNAPSAGPPQYTIFRIVTSKVFGLPGMYGMDQFDPDELPKSTRWDFDDA